MVQLARTLLSLTLITVLPSIASAFEFLVGVGKDETTGKKGIGFDPSVIHPQPGDTISFQFRSGSHSVVQSTFETPCVASGGFNSGVQTVDDGLAVDAPGLPVVHLTVNDTNPIWLFDEAGGLCYKGGVLAVNPTQDKTAAAFKANAANAGATPATTSSSSGSATGSLTTATTPSSTSKSNAVCGKNLEAGLVFGSFLLSALVTRVIML